MATLPQRTYDLHLVFGRDAEEDGHVIDTVCELVLAPRFHLLVGESDGARLVEAKVSCYRNGRLFAIAREHHDLDPTLPRQRNGFPHASLIVRTYVDIHTHT